jgi:hypothetical protein
LASVGLLRQKWGGGGEKCISLFITEMYTITLIYYRNCFPHQGCPFSLGDFSCIKSFEIKTLNFANTAYFCVLRRFLKKQHFSEHLNTFCRQNIQFLNIIPGGTYSKLWASKG